jgi:hypothetical protein
MVRCAPSIGSGSARVAFNRGRLAPRSGAQQPFHRSRPDDGLHARSPIEYGYFVRSAICWMAIHSPASAVDHQKMPPEKSALAKSPVLKGCRSRFLKLLDGYAHAKVSAVILLLLPGHRHAGFFWLMECDCRIQNAWGLPPARDLERASSSAIDRRFGATPRSRGLRLDNDPPNKKARRCRAFLTNKFDAQFISRAWRSGARAARPCGSHCSCE